MEIDSGREMCYPIYRYGQPWRNFIFVLFKHWRVVRVVEGARLESVCTVNAVPRVRISHSPPFV